MRVLLAVLAIASAPVRPIPHYSLLEIDARTTGRNYLPTRMLPGFTYYRWSFKGNVMRVDFRDQAGRVIEWRIEPMTGSCDTGKQQSYQLSGNKVWWAQQGAEQVAWRCAFDQRGKAVRLAAASTAPVTKLAGAGLGIVAASAKRY